jgi:hypothetical protein
MGSKTQAKILLEYWLEKVNLFTQSVDGKHIKLSNLLTYSMEHSSSWEANRFAASQEIPRIL